jgi:hypothetical protein
MNIQKLLKKVGLTEKEAKTLFRYLMSEVEEDLHNESEALFNEVANRNGYGSFSDYLENVLEK